MFDTSAILYTNALYVVLMLFPLHLKETATYHRICKWVFVIVNGLALAINLADSVYFRYTMRRTTSTVFDEFSSEGNLGSIIGTEFLSHWYLVVLFALLMVFLWKCYAAPSLDAKMLNKWKYAGACFLSLLLFTPSASQACVAVLLQPYAPSPSPTQCNIPSAPLMRPWC